MTNIIVCRDYFRRVAPPVHACSPHPKETAGMITEVTMPQLGLEVTHGTVTALFVEPGATVRRDEPLLELETDKASTDVVAPRDGIVRSIDVLVGQEVEIG